MFEFHEHPSKWLYIYIYMYMHMYTYVYTYIHINLSTVRSCFSSTSMTLLLRHVSAAPKRCQSMAVARDRPTQWRGQTLWIYPEWNPVIYWSNANMVTNTAVISRGNRQLNDSASRKPDCFGKVRPSLVELTVNVCECYSCYKLMGLSPNSLQVPSSWNDSDSTWWVAVRSNRISWWLKRWDTSCIG